MLNSMVDTMSQQKKLFKRCCFCGLSDEDELKFGKIYEHEDIITHYYCLVLCFCDFYILNKIISHYNIIVSHIALII